MLKAKPIIINDLFFFLFFEKGVLQSSYLCFSQAVFAFALIVLHRIQFSLISNCLYSLLSFTHFSLSSRVLVFLICILTNLFHSCTFPIELVSS